MLVFVKHQLKGHSLDSAVRKLNPLLRLAAISGVEAAIKFHILRGDDLDARDSGGATPLILAAARKNKRAVRLLLDAGADPTLVDRQGMDALTYALQANCPETVEILTEANRINSFRYAKKKEIVKERSDSAARNAVFLCDEHMPEGDSPLEDSVMSISPEYQPELSVPKITMPLISEDDFLSLDDTPLDAEFEDDWVAEEETVAPVGDEHLAARHLTELERLGIRRLTIWECALKGRLRHDPERLLEVIAWWLSSGYCHAEIAGGRELLAASDGHK